METPTVPVQIHCDTPTLVFWAGNNAQPGDVNGVTVTFELSTFTGSVSGSATYTNGSGWSIEIKRDESAVLMNEPPIYEWIKTCLSIHVREWLLTLRESTEKIWRGLEKREGGDSSSLCKCRYCAGTGRDNTCAGEDSRCGWCGGSGTHQDIKVAAVPPESDPAPQNKPVDYASQPHGSRCGPCLGTGVHDAGRSGRTALCGRCGGRGSVERS